MRRIWLSLRRRWTRQGPENRKRPNGQAQPVAAASTLPQGRDSRRKPANAPSLLSADQSAEVRDCFLSAALGSAGTAAGWAREGLAAKNRLVAADAKAVEDAFELRLDELARQTSST